MKYTDNGLFFKVKISAREVEDFGYSWPCSGLMFHSITFEYDKRNGDLVDSDADRYHPGADGSALLALSQDAQAFGLEQMEERQNVI